jgi:hypothetical protein
MNKLIITDFPGNPFATPRALRASALNWQLSALGAQAKAIEAIANEHMISLADMPPDGLVTRAQDIVRTATRIAAECERESMDVILPRIVTLRDSCEALQNDADRFVRIADQRAHFRLSTLLPVLFEKDAEALTGADCKEKEDQNIVPDADKLNVSASSRCYKAESEQHGTFALQIKSICNLALEMALAAAADFAPRSSES